MKTLKNKLTNLLTLKRNAIKHTDAETNYHPDKHNTISTDNKTGAIQLESQQAANDKDNRPDWFQAIHGTEYYKD